MYFRFFWSNGNQQMQVSKKVSLGIEVSNTQPHILKSWKSLAPCQVLFWGVTLTVIMRGRCPQTSSKTCHRALSKECMGLCGTHVNQCPDEWRWETCSHQVSNLLHATRKVTQIFRATSQSINLLHQSSIGERSPQKAGKMRVREFFSWQGWGRG